jgi:LysR family hydrogen peroxide-inducible transcriptional activator
MIPLPSPQQLRYLVALAEHSHFGRAAAACAVTQSTLSSGILALERQLDAPLLERTGGKRPVFTPLGRDLVARARAVLASLTALVETVDAAREPLTGSLRLGLIPTIAPFLLPRLMPRLRASFPRLHLWLREDLADDLRDGLESGRLDLLLLTLPVDCGDAETLVVGDEPFLFACATGHRLAQHDAITPAVLTGERLLLLDEGHCLRDQALAACGLPAAPLSEEFATTSLHSLVQMVAGGLGVTVLPRMAVAGGIATGAEVTLRPLAGGGGRRIGLAWRARSPRADEFRALAPSIAAALADL